MTKKQFRGNKGKPPQAKALQIVKRGNSFGIAETLKLQIGRNIMINCKNVATKLQHQQKFEKWSLNRDSWHFEIRQQI